MSKKVHAIDTRLRVNAGMDFPTCRANDKMLDLRILVPLTNLVAEITCKNCLRKIRRAK